MSNSSDIASLARHFGQFEQALCDLLGILIDTDYDEALIFTTPQNAMVTRSSVQSISHETYTAVTFDTESWDNDNLYDAGSPTLFTIQHDGYYELDGYVIFALDADGTRKCRFVKNGAPVTGWVEVVVPGSATAYCSMQILDQVSLEEGDTIALQVWQTSGGGALNLAAYPHMSIIRIA